jgi:flagellar hook-associated protein 1 FlgK
MGGLSGIMFLATQALSVDEGALQVTSNNISNANTPGYSRQVAELESAPPVLEGNLEFGQGVELTGVQGIRNQVWNWGYNKACSLRLKSTPIRSP